MMSNSIDVPATDRCAFCDYLAGRRPFTVLSRDGLVAVLVTREQRGIGHLLVIPVAHRETLLELEPSEGSAIMSSVIAAGRAITLAYKSEGLAVWQNNGDRRTRPFHTSIFMLLEHCPKAARSGATLRRTRFSRLRPSQPGCAPS